MIRHIGAKPKGGIDWLGLGLLSTGIAALQYVLERGQHEDWFNSKTIVALSVTSIVALLASESTTAWMALAGGVTNMHGVSIPQVNGMLAQQSTAIAYSYLFRICAFVFLAALPFVAFIRPAPKVATA